MAVMIPNAVALAHDGDVWRAALGEHAANSLDPFEAIVLVAGKAREAGHVFSTDPLAPSKPEAKRQAPKTESSADEPAKPATP